MTITVVSATNNYHNVLWESTAPADGVWVSLPWPNIVLPDHAIGENVPKCQIYCRWCQNQWLTVLVLGPNVPDLWPNQIRGSILGL